MNYIRCQILVYDGTEKGTLAQKSSLVATVFESRLEDYGLAEEIQVIETGNLGLYSEGVVVIVHPENICYDNVKPADVAEIVEEHLLKGRPVERLMMADQLNASKKVAASLQEIGFYKRQKRIVLRNCGIIDPESIEEYIAVGGYEALGRALTEQSPQEVIDILKASGLRDRGGSGFPTGQRWQMTHDATTESRDKCVCCDADEGDTSAFMARSVLEGDPFAIVEAMTIAAYAVGANQGYIYVPADYPIAVRRLNNAIAQATEYGLLGDNIFESGFSFHLETSLAASACGGETSLMNNVETYANITWILNNGPEAFSAIGTEKAKGTKVFALGGKINRPGMVEIPMGTSLREIIYDIGGGIPGGKAFRAAQIGGSPVSVLDTPVEYEALAALGSEMGAGGLIVMDEDD